MRVVPMCAEDLAAAAGPLVREAWMTDLPPEKRPGAVNPMAQVNVRSFSRFGNKPRGDTSGWTHTPGQAPKAQGPLALPAVPSSVLALEGGLARPQELHTCACVFMCVRIVSVAHEPVLAACGLQVDNVRVSCLHSARTCLFVCLSVCLSHSLPLAGGM